MSRELDYFWDSRNSGSFLEFLDGLLKKILLKDFLLTNDRNFPTFHEIVSELLGVREYVCFQTQC
jgi:hypothetical protein